MHRLKTGLLNTYYASAGSLAKRMTLARTPHRTYALGMRLFLASLGMLFGSSLLGYIMIRLTTASNVPRGAIHFPHLLWLSTALVLLGSFTLHMSVHAISLEKQKAFRQWFLMSMVIAVLFLLVQIPCLLSMLSDHFKSLQSQQQISADTGRQAPGMPLYGLGFFLITLHALHVVGGVIALAVVGHKGFRNAYDHEYHSGPTFAAVYWHFLDIVWIILFGTLLLLG